MYGIIYKATNCLTGKVYIGQTTRGLRKRRREHEVYSKNSSTHFANAMNKHGAGSFIWEEVVCASNQEELDLLESKYIELNKSTDRLVGYNIKSGGARSSGHTLSPDQMKKRIGCYTEEKNGRWIDINIDDLHKFLIKNASIRDCALSFGVHKRTILRRLKKYFPTEYASMEQGFIYFVKKNVSKYATAKGKRWMNKEEIELLVKSDSVGVYLEKGWALGRNKRMKNIIKNNHSKTDNAKNKLWVHKIGENGYRDRKRVRSEEAEMLLSKNWIMGY